MIKRHFADADQRVAVNLPGQNNVVRDVCRASHGDDTARRIITEGISNAVVNKRLTPENHGRTN